MKHDERFESFLAEQFPKRKRRYTAAKAPMQLSIDFWEGTPPERTDEPLTAPSKEHLKALAREHPKKRRTREKQVVSAIRRNVAGKQKLTADYNALAMRSVAINETTGYNNHLACYCGVRKDILRRETRRLIRGMLTSGIYTETTERSLTCVNSFHCIRCRQPFHIKKVYVDPIAKIQELFPVTQESLF